MCHFGGRFESFVQGHWQIFPMKSLGVLCMCVYMNKYMNFISIISFQLDLFVSYLGTLRYSNVKLHIRPGF